MNFEDYVNQMTKKYQLAVAIAVLKNKPPGLTTDQYIEQLREKINEQNYENVDIDLLCSDDFNIDDNDFEFNDEIIVNDNLDDTALDIIVTLTTDRTHNDRIDDQSNIHDLNNIEIEEVAKNDSLQHFDGVKENVKIQEVATIIVASSASNSNDKSPGSSSFYEFLKTLKAIDQNTPTEQDLLTNNFTQDMFGENSQTILPINNNLTENMTVDNQPFYNLNIITENRENDFTIDEKLKSKIAKNIRTEKEIIQKENFSYNKVSQDFDMEIPSNIIDCLLNEEQVINKKLVEQKTAIVVKNIEREIAKNKQEDNNKYNIFDCQNNSENMTRTNKSDTLADDTQKTIPYTLHGFTETQISQSQNQNFEISNKFIFGNKIKTNVNNFDNNPTYYVENATKITKETTEDRAQNSNKRLFVIDSTQIQYVIDNDGKTYAVLQSFPLNDNPKAVARHNDTNIEMGHEFSPSGTPDINNDEQNFYAAVKNKGQDIDMNATVASDKQKEFNNKSIYKLNKSDNIKDIEIETNATSLDTQKDFNPEHTYLNTSNFEDQNENDENQGIEMSSEKTAVPFKVVKELSEIKSFLKRKERRDCMDGFSSDSGYKSDSQSSFKSAHFSDLSENRMHQSAYCLYNYIVQCPLVAVTQEIIAEISQILGRLIDRLYEEEKYPNFVEELLDKIDNLLRELYEVDSSSDDMLLQKDELMQRLLLLNKSTHILKFTIDKISVILEKAHALLISEETLYELSNIREVENLCYVFNLLEILIQRYIKNKNKIKNENTQNSQETKLLRKSSISEIWRKKWNPNFKEIKNAGNHEKRCCLEKCGVVLNKIIVECMDGYSLVSFAALQCFNLLQNQ